MSDNEFSELQAIDFALGAYIAGAFSGLNAVKGPKQWRDFLSRENNKRIFRDDSDGPSEFLQHLSSSGKTEKTVDGVKSRLPQLPVAYYYRKPGMTNGEGRNFPGRVVRLEDTLKAFDLTLSPVELDYHLVFAAWDKLSLDKLQLAWYQYVIKNARFEVQYEIAGEPFPVGAWVGDPKTVVFSDASIPRTEGRLFAVDSTLTVQTSILFGVEVTPAANPTLSPSRAYGAVFLARIHSGIAMADTKTPLLQSVKKDGKDLDLSFCKEAIFVETLDLSGPRLILTFDDTLSILRNVMQVKVGDILDCVLADPWHEDKLNLTAGFQVMSMPVDGELVTVNCLQKEIADMKIPAAKARLFSKEGSSISGIMKALAPGFTSYEGDGFALLNPYHLLPGERPSLVLRQMAIEHGAVVYASRGKLCFKKLADIFGSATDVTFEYKNPQAKFQVVTYNHLNKEQLIADRVVRRNSGFHITEGFISAEKYSDAAPEITSADTQAVMDNLSVIAVPILDIITWGAGHLCPGTADSIQMEYGRCL